METFGKCEYKLFCLEVIMCEEQLDKYKKVNLNGVDMTDVEVIEEYKIKCVSVIWVQFNLKCFFMNIIGNTADSNRVSNLKE